jgi:hypothetical protein
MNEGVLPLRHTFQNLYDLSDRSSPEVVPSCLVSCGLCRRSWPRRGRRGSGSRERRRRERRSWYVGSRRLSHESLVIHPAQMTWCCIHNDWCSIPQPCNRPAFA